MHLKLFREHQTEHDSALELDELANRTLQQFQQRVPQPVFHCAHPPIIVTANAEKLSAVIGHTIGNAIEATNDRGHVSVDLAANNQWAELCVEDDGTGMDPEFVEHTLFQPFESTKGLTGMGIGAYQTREYIRSIGGDVQVDTNPGEGTRFTLRIPLAANG